MFHHSYSLISECVCVCVYERASITVSVYFREMLVFQETELLDVLVSRYVIVDQSVEL